MENERFIQLLTSKIANELTDAEREELRILIANHPELRYRKEILNKFWKRKRVSSRDNMAMFEKLMAQIEASDGLTENVPAQQYEEHIVHLRSFRRYWQSAAAAILLGMVALYYSKSTFFNDQTLTTKWFQRSTKPTVRSKITLSDGTMITMNSASTIKYPERFTGNTREVYLNGEAYFDVHKDHKHPFIIHANKMNVKVLGTSFNVKSYLNEPISETTLIRGSVEVTLNDRPSDRIILKPQEKLIVKNNLIVRNQQNIRELPDVKDRPKGTNYSLTSLTHFPNNDKTIVETSWVQNKLVFSDKDFSELSVQLERWYGVHFIFVNESMKTERFSGIFEKETLSEALDALKIVTPFKYRIIKSTVYIYTK